MRELSFSFGPGADRYLPKNAVHATVSPSERESVEGITSMQVGPEELAQEVCTWYS